MDISTYALGHPVSFRSRRILPLRAMPGMYIQTLYHLVGTVYLLYVHVCLYLDVLFYALGHPVSFVAGVGYSVSRAMVRKYIETVPL